MTDDKILRIANELDAAYPTWDINQDRWVLGFARRIEAACYGEPVAWVDWHKPQGIRWLPQELGLPDGQPLYCRRADTPNPAVEGQVSWGEPKQSYPGGPVYRVGTSSGVVMQEMTTERGDTHNPAVNANYSDTSLQDIHERGDTPTPRTELPASITGEEWGAIQSRVDQDCPMSIVAQLGSNPPIISWHIAADRIVAYAESAYVQGRIFGEGTLAAANAENARLRELLSDCPILRSAYRK